MLKWKAKTHYLLFIGIDIWVSENNLQIIDFVLNILLIFIIALFIQTTPPQPKQVL